MWSADIDIVLMIVMSKYVILKWFRINSTKSAAYERTTEMEIHIKMVKNEGQSLRRWGIYIREDVIGFDGRNQDRSSDGEFCSISRILSSLAYLMGDL